MISNFDDLKTQVIVRGGIDTTSAYWTDDILNDWIQSATRWATAYKKWPMTNGRVSTTWAGVEEIAFEGYSADSLRFVQIGGNKLQKLNFEDYQIMKEFENNSQQRYYTSFGRLLMVNPSVDLSGTLTAYGQYTPADLDVTDLTSRTIFSDGDEDGNEAIVEEVLAYMNTREKKEQEALVHHQKASQILDSLWERVNDERYAAQPHRARGGMWQRFNVTAGGMSDEIVKRDQFPFG